MTTTDSIDLSVIIVSWNTRDLLARCLRALEREIAVSDLRAEIVVVDNGSTDGSPSLVVEQFPSVHLVRLSENRGFAAANNLAIQQHTRGDAILLLNPDTEVQPGALGALWRALHAAPHVGLVGAALLNPDGTLQSTGYRFPGLIQVILDFFPVHPRLVGSGVNGRISPGDGLSPMEIDHPLGACMLVRRQVVREVGLLDEGYFMYSEEVDWCRRIKAAGWTILVAPSARVVHHGGQSTGQVPDRMVVELHRSRLRYYRRYHSARFVSAVGALARAAAMIEGRRSPSARERAAVLRDVARLYQEADRDDA